MKKEAESCPVVQCGACILHCDVSSVGMSEELEYILLQYISSSSAGNTARKSVSVDHSVDCSVQ